MLKETAQVCIGILAGLYRFEHESSSEFKDWAVYIPFFYAEDTLKKWRTKSVSQEAVDEMKSFIQTRLPEWKRLHRILEKARTTGR